MHPAAGLTIKAGMGIVHTVDGDRLATRAPDGSRLTVPDTGLTVIADLTPEQRCRLQFGIGQYAKDALARAELRSEEYL